MKHDKSHTLSIDVHSQYPSTTNINISIYVPRISYVRMWCLRKFLILACAEQDHIAQTNIFIDMPKISFIVSVYVS